jgi:uncharacterized iron-regulated protein
VNSVLTLSVLLAQSWLSPAAIGSVVVPPLSQSPAPGPSASGYVPQRVYDSRAKAFTDFETMVADLARTDVVLIGEQHDDANTHRLELAVLEALARRRVAVALSLEMFERDVQTAVDTYVAGSSVEADFLKNARPWPRYATDYRPLVEFAKSRRWPVMAANVPRRIASDVARSGQSAVDALSADDRQLTASDLQCPHDAYFDRFAGQMGEHPPGAPGATNDGSLDRYYLAQCLKDETMAESIAAAFVREEARRGVVVHITGAFHSDFGDGTGERVRRRLQDRRVTILSIVPVGDIDALAPDPDDLRRADYLVYTVK